MTTEELNTFLSDSMPSFTLAWFATIKERAGYSSSITAFDQEITDYMEAAVTDMLTGGVPASMFVDAEPIDKRILNAIAQYVKAYIEHDRTDTPKYLDLFHRLVFKLSIEDGGAWDVDDNDSDS